MPSDSLGHTKREIAQQLKRGDLLTLATLAERLKISREAVRVQINEMIHDGWVSRDSEPQRDGKAGRPATVYRLTLAGQHLFPKHYDELANLLLKLVAGANGKEPLQALLADITDARMGPWRERLKGLELGDKLKLLKDLYWNGDPYVEIHKNGHDWFLVEQNCPFLNVAMEHQALCSTTVSMLTRLLGLHVVRERRFQTGDNRCVFRIVPDRPRQPRGFELEPGA